LTKKLIRRIPAKRLRPGLVPDDVFVNVIGSATPYNVGELHTEGNITVLYEAFAGGVIIGLDRIEDIEHDFGPESVFEDREGTCYVAATAFD